MNQHIEYYKNKLAYEMDSWDLFDALDHNENIIVIDARSAEAYKICHIPKSLNIPHRTMDVKTTNHLDRSALYVCYCDGIGCNASTKGALKMAELGFNVKELIGGLDWWKRDGYSTEGDEAKEGLKSFCGC